MIKLKKLVQVETKRYQKKGFVNTLIGCLLLGTIIWGSHEYGSRLWPQKIENQNQFVILISFVIHFGAQFLFFFIYIGGYMSTKNWLQKYRINKKTIRTWERNDWPQTRKKFLLNMLMNFVIVYPIVVYLATNFGGINLRFEGFPTNEIIVQLIIMYVIDDFFFYFFHRLGHQNKYLYSHHKIHHQFDNPFTFTAQYTSAFEYIFVNMLPPALAVLLLGNRVHCFTFFMWQVWKIFISVQNHSGYDLPFTPIKILPLSIQPSYHDFHHSKNVKNYSGSLIIWDLIFGTYNQTYYDDFDKQS